MIFVEKNDVDFEHFLQKKGDNFAKKNSFLAKNGKNNNVVFDFF